MVKAIISSMIRIIRYSWHRVTRRRHAMGFFRSSTPRHISQREHMQDAMLIRWMYIVSMATPLLCVQSIFILVLRMQCILLFFLVAIKVSGNKTIQNMTFPPTWYNACKQVLVLSISDRFLIKIESTSKHLQILTRNFRISVCKCKLRRKSILYFYTLLVFTMTEQRATLRSEQ